jgi:hypothetical protein
LGTAASLGGVRRVSERGRGRVTGKNGDGERALTTWLYVANGVGVEEKLRASEGIVWDLAFRLERGSRIEGIRNRRRSETAIVGCGDRLLD